MKDLIRDSIRVDNSRPPLRWIANWFGSIASSAIMRISWAEEYEKNYGFRYKLDGLIWDYLWPIYNKYGTFYKLDMDLSGAEWDDYDADGIPYWEKWTEWDYEGEVTGDAFRVIEKTAGYTGRWSDDDDFRITPFLGDNR